MGEATASSVGQGRFAALENRIELFAALPLGSLDRLSLQNWLDSIRRKLPGTAAA